MSIYDINKSVGKTHNKLIFTIGEHPHTIAFLSGGELALAWTVKAGSSGGQTHEGLYDEVTVEGEVTVSLSLAQELRKIFVMQHEYVTRNATHVQYSRTDSFELKHVFNNVVISKLPQFEIPELGSAVTLKIAFSLNDMVTDVLKANIKPMLEIV